MTFHIYSLVFSTLLYPPSGLWKCSQMQSIMFDRLLQAQMRFQPTTFVVPEQNLYPSAIRVRHLPYMDMTFQWWVGIFSATALLN